MNSQIAAMFGSVAARATADPTSAVSATATNNGQYGTSGGGRFDILTSGETLATEMIGRASLGILFAAGTLAVVFYLWTRRIQGGG